jgi:hypothetical protein
MTYFSQLGKSLKAVLPEACAMVLSQILLSNALKSSAPWQRRLVYCRCAYHLKGFWSPRVVVAFTTADVLPTYSHRPDRAQGDGVIEEKNESAHKLSLNPSVNTTSQLTRAVFLGKRCILLDTVQEFFAHGIFT